MQMTILGDLNFNYQIDESLSTNPIHLIENLFQMSQIIEEPTRKTPTTSTLLDVILTSVPDRHTKTKVIKTAFSDHYSLFTTIYTDQRRQRNELHNLVKFRDYKNLNEEAFLLDLRHNDWFLHDENDVEESWKHWKRQLTEICNKHAPFAEKRIKARKCPWITPDIVKLMYRRDSIHGKAVHSNNDLEWNECRSMRNYINNTVKSAKEQYH